MISNNFLFWVRKYEDFDAHPRLSKEGFVRLGFGRNIDEKGITVGEGNLMLENDLSIIQLTLNSIDWFSNLAIFVQDALIHLCYIMRIDRVFSIDGLIDCLKRLDYSGAAKIILDLNHGVFDPLQYARLKDIALLISEGHGENAPAA